jgi:hypothetical protein
LFYFLRWKLFEFSNQISYVFLSHLIILSLGANITLSSICVYRGPSVVLWVHKHVLLCIYTFILAVYIHHQAFPLLLLIALPLLYKVFNLNIFREVLGWLAINIVIIDYLWMMLILNHISFISNTSIESSVILDIWKVSMIILIMIKVTTAIIPTKLLLMLWRLFLMNARVVLLLFALHMTIVLNLYQ